MLSEKYKVATRPKRYCLPQVAHMLLDEGKGHCLRQEIDLWEKYTLDIDILHTSIFYSAN